MNTKKTNIHYLEKSFFIATPIMYCMYLLLMCYAYRSYTADSFFYAALFIYFVSMLAIMPGFFSFVRAKDKYYAENIKSDIRHSIPGITFCTVVGILFYCKTQPFYIFAMIFFPLIVLAAQYAGNIVFFKEKDRADIVVCLPRIRFGVNFLLNKNSTKASLGVAGKLSYILAILFSANGKNKSDTIPSIRFGEKFLNKDKYNASQGIGDKLSYIAVLLFSVFVVFSPIIALLFFKYDNEVLLLNLLPLLCILMALSLVFLEKERFSEFAYKNILFRLFRLVLSISAGIILFVYNLFFFCGFFNADKILDFMGMIVCCFCIVSILCIYAESCIALRFLVSRKRKIASNLNICVNNQTSKILLVKSFFTKIIGFSRNLCLKIINAVKKTPIKTKGFAKFAIIVLLVLIGIVSYKFAHQHKAGEAYKIAEMYYYGNGVEKDEAEAAKWYARSSDPKAWYKLGKMYRWGWGVTKNKPEAAKWYRKAAVQGHTEAQYELGLMYDMGWGVAKNEPEAAKWFLNAAKSGHSHAQMYIGIAYEHGWGVKQDYYDAVKWFKKSADQGDTLGILYLGQMYEKGLGGLPQSNSEAIRLYKKANAQISGIADKDLKRVRGY